MNGLVEANIRIVKEMSAAMLLHSKLSISYERFAIEYACYVRNHMVQGKGTTFIPFQRFYQREPIISRFIPFGCLVTIWESPEQRQRLKRKLEKGKFGVFLGMVGENLLACLDLNSQKVSHYFHVQCHITVFPGLKKPTLKGGKYIVDDSTVEGISVEDIDNQYGDESEDHLSDTVSDTPPYNLRKRSTPTSVHISQDEEEVFANFIRCFTGSVHIPDYDSKTIQSLDTTAYNNKISQITMPRPTKEKINWPTMATTSYPQELGEMIERTKAPKVPRTVREAVEGPFGPYFLRAMFEEITSIKDMKTWKVKSKDDIQANRRIIRSKWVFDYKIDKENYIIRFKARLVAMGNDQIENVDYKNTFSPVVKIQSVRFIISLSILFGLKIEQTDIKTAFLYGNLTEKNYMKMPQGFEEYTKDGVEMICELQQSLYGLHQSSSEWYECLKSYLLKNGFNRSVYEPCLFYIVDKSAKKVFFLLVYVDDMLLISNRESLIDDVKNILKKRFQIQENGLANWILKIRMERVSGGIWIGQNLKIQDALEYAGFDMYSGNLPRIPMIVGWKDVDSVLLDENQSTFYRSLLMKLSYVAIHTRPDISFAINKLAQYQQEPTQHHLDSLYQVLLYLKNTEDYGLFYRKPSQSIYIMFESECQPEGYADASFMDEESRKSRSGYVFISAGAAVSWSSKRQSLITLSSTESEYVALAECVREGLWYRNLLSELDFGSNSPMKINQDNQSTIYIALNPIQQQRTKHMDLRYRFIQEHIKNHEFELIYCSTEHMIADILTKPLPPKQFEVLRRCMGLESLNDLQLRNTEDCISNMVVNLL